MSTRLQRLVAAAGMQAVPFACFAVDSGSAAYGNGKTFGYVVGGLLLFLLARRLLGGPAWSRWLIVPVIAVALFRLLPSAGGGELSAEQIQALAADVGAEDVVCTPPPSACNALKLAA